MSINSSWARGSTNFGQHARKNRPRRTVAHARDFDRRNPRWHQFAENAGVFALDLLRFGNRSPQTDGKIVGEVIPADRNGRRVAHDAAGIRDQFRGAAADIEQAAAEFALVLREARFGGSEGLEHRIVHAHSGAIHGGDNVLRGCAGSRHDMHVRFEALADHANGVANIVLRIERKFLRKHVRELRGLPAGVTPRAASMARRTSSRCTSRGARSQR